MEEWRNFIIEVIGEYILLIVMEHYFRKGVRVRTTEVAENGGYSADSVGVTALTDDGVENFTPH